MPSSDKELAELRIRVERLESQMVFLFRNLGITAQDAPEGLASERVLELLAEGDRNGAIRALREETGASLKDAKTLVESLAR